MRGFKRTSLITVFCVFILIGIAISKKVFISFDWQILFISPILLIFLKKNYLSLMAVIVAGLIIGILRGDSYVAKFQNIKSLEGKEVSLRVTAANDAIYGKKSQIQFNATNLNLANSNTRLAGKAAISGFGVPMVYRGDRVLVTGKVYLARGSNQIRISYAQLQIIGPSEDYFSKIARTFSAGVENALPEPQASFAMGILVGQRTNLPSSIIDQLTAVGLIHIVAVSGYNLTILTRASQRLKLGSKYQKALLSLLLIVSFLLLTGTSASIVRAAIVSLLSLIAWYYGRTIKPLLLLSFTAAITALYNPFYVWSDIGWYLSFLAFFGVLVVAPVIEKRFNKNNKKLLTSVLIETLSAEAMTLPLVMFVFSQVSLVSLLANLLIVPLIPFAMLLSAIAALAGAAIPMYAGWLAWPSTIILTYILDIVNGLSNVPNALLKVNINATLMISSYFVICAFIIKTYFKRRPPEIT